MHDPRVLVLLAAVVATLFVAYRGSGQLFQRDGQVELLYGFTSSAGASVGDELLRLVGLRLTGALPPGAVLAHLGGDDPYSPSFVLALGDGAGEAIVRAVVELGHALGLRVVAEGIEDQATMDRLRALGCDLPQGYLLSRPQPPVALDEWLTARDEAAARPPVAGAPADQVG